MDRLIEAFERLVALCNANGMANCEEYVYLVSLIREGMQLKDHEIDTLIQTIQECGQVSINPTTRSLAGWRSNHSID